MCRVRRREFPREGEMMGLEGRGGEMRGALGRWRGVHRVRDRCAVFFDTGISHAVCEGFVRVRSWAWVLDSRWV